MVTPFLLPNAIPQFGYTAKTLLGKWLDEQLSVALRGTMGYFVWFALDANEVRNADSSNPLKIFEELDTAVKSNDSSNWKVSETLRSMVLAVSSNRHQLGLGIYSDLLDELDQAPIGAFRPQLWRIDLPGWNPSAYVQVDAVNEYQTIGYTLPPGLFLEAIP